MGLYSLNQIINAAPTANPGCFNNPIPYPNGIWTTDPIQTLTNNSQIAQNVSASWKCQWDNLIISPTGTQPSGLYQLFAQGGTIFAVACLGWFILDTFKKLDSNSKEEGAQGIVQVFLAAVVSMLLVNNATLLAQFTRPIPDIVTNTVTSVLGQTANNLALGSAYKSVTGYQSAKQAIEKLVTPCLTKAIASEREICMYGQANISPVSGQYGPPAPVPLTATNYAATSVYAQVQKVVQRYQSLYGLLPGGTNGLLNLQGYVDTWTGLTSNGLMGAWNAMNNATTTGMMFAKSQMDQMAFANNCQAALLLTAMTGPIAVGLSLLPGGFKTFTAWLGALFAVGSLIIFYNLILSIVASVVVNANAWDSLWFAQFISDEAPKLAEAMAGFGGVSVVWAGWTWGARGVEQAKDAAVTAIKFFI